MHANTQALLDLVASPSIITPTQITAAIADFLPGAYQLDQQMSVIESAVQTAIIAEEDPQLRALLSQYLQKTGGLKRLVSEIVGKLRDVNTGLDGIKRVDAGVRDYVASQAS